jgi:3-oxoacyl-[acyl-carrier protein] reductase
MSLIDLSGKVALVTGGSRGVGAATALLLSEAGASVAISYRERKDAADEVLGGMEGASVAVRADFSNPADCDRMVEETVQSLGQLDIFIANAGIWVPHGKAVTEMEDAQWTETLGINLSAVFYGCRAALRVMQPGGQVVIVGSTAGQRGEAYHADYAATKGAIIAFVKSLAGEAARDRITVNCVAPGWIDTEMCDVPYGADGGDGKRRIEAAIPLGRVATPAEIAGPIVFLCSQLAAHVTGETLNVNGGSVMCG